MMNPIPADRTSRIKSWLAGLEATDDHQKTTQLIDSTIENERKSKRLRTRSRALLACPADEDEVYFASAPQTPPLTDSQSISMAPDDPSVRTPTAASGQARKRRNEDMEKAGDGNDAVLPCDGSALLHDTSSSRDCNGNAEPEGLSSQGRPQPPVLKPNPRKRSRSKPKTRAVLGQLEKPIRIFAIHHARERLPADVATLYTQIFDANDRDNIVPHEVRQEVERLEPDVKDRYFRKPDPDANGRSRAKEVFATLSRIISRAADSHIHRRSESGWNQAVHVPLLDLVYTAAIPRQAGQGVEARVSVRWESVSSATITSDSIPFLRATSHSSAQPAISVSADTSILSGSGSEAGSHLSWSQMRSSSVKVDYVLAIDVPEETPLREAISFVTNHEKAAIPHVNQTAYLPLKDSPIAVSIETKQETPSKDPLVQLAIWTAAWYQHMCDLREHLVGAGPKPPLGSVLLVQVVGHTWQLYFAHDIQSAIDIYGPIPLGSTDNILSAYVLLNSLEAIKRWTEDTFYSSMKRWFLCDSSLEGHGHVA